MHANDNKIGHVAYSPNAYINLVKINTGLHKKRTYLCLLFLQRNFQKYAFLLTSQAENYYQGPLIADCIKGPKGNLLKC